MVSPHLILSTLWFLHQQSFYPSPYSLKFGFGFTSRSLFFNIQLSLLSQNIQLISATFPQWLWVQHLHLQHGISFMTGFNLYISTGNMKKNSGLLWINVEKTVCECIYIYNFSSMIVSLTLTFGSSFLFYFFYVETGGKNNNREWNTWKSWTPL